MKIVAISDTHGKYKDLNLPSGDLIIHAGDITKRSNLEECEDFLNWFSNLDYKYKVFIAGNHDFYFEKMNDEILKEIIPNNVYYLNDSGIELEGLKIWGSPIQPWFFGWAFNRHRGESIKNHWDLIPNNTDILITHGPPYGILDKTITGQKVGCNDLLKKVYEVKPKVHIFGHIHEAYGITEENNIKFVNASSLDIKYKLKNKPIEIEI